MIPDLIYDVGMNNGDDTAYYLHLGFRVVAIEANPELVATARTRFADALGAGRLALLNVGIAAEAGEAEFWICDSMHGLSSFDRALASRGGPTRSVIVPCRTFAAVVAEQGVPHYAKIDIEGRDALCLAGFPPDDLPQYVSLETSETAMLDRLRDRGYSEFQWIHQHRLVPLEWPPAASHRWQEQLLRWSRSRRLALRIARRAGAGRWIDTQLRRTRTHKGWTFSAGSSGPFAEGLPGRWQGYDEMRATITRYEAMRARGETSILWDWRGDWFWVDLHARRASPSR